jgi:hypothetical protein
MVPEEVERKMDWWFRHLPREHPLVKALYKAALDRILVVREVPAPQPRRRR